MLGEESLTRSPNIHIIVLETDICKSGRSQRWDRNASLRSHSRGVTRS